jgi:NTP pyrophosphatase (non-canonical NTP hydrolase)
MSRPEPFGLSAGPSADTQFLQSSLRYGIYRSRAFNTRLPKCPPHCASHPPFFKASGKPNRVSSPIASGYICPNMSDHKVSELTEAVVRHRDEREWGQFHTPKELAISLCVESAELLGLMQWKTGSQLDETVQAKHDQIRDELADVLHSILLLASELNISPGEALLEKLAKDVKKYPVDKARGKNLKYDEL